MYHKLNETLPCQKIHIEVELAASFLKFHGYKPSRLHGELRDVYIKHDQVYTLQNALENALKNSIK